MDEPIDAEEEALERLAESLVSAALDGYERVLSPTALQDMREYLIDELLCSSYGRARLRRLGALPTVDASTEIVRDHDQLSQIKKEGSGS